MIFPVLSELTVAGVFERGVPNQERVVLRVNAMTNLGGFLLARGPWANGNVIALQNDGYFYFPDEVVLPNSWVVLYTAPGTKSQTRHPQTNEPVLVLHWGQPTVQFASTKVGCALLRINGIALAPR